MHVAARIIVNLSYRIWRHLWYPFAWMWQRVFGIAVLIGFSYLLWNFFGDDGADEPIPPPPAIASPEMTGEAPPKPIATSGASTPIEAVSKTQDGNSVFSEDLIPKMRGEELRHYSEQFYYAMGQIPDGQAYSWNFFNIHGTITSTHTFTNNLGHVCRRFNEVLKVHEIQQTIEGVGCEQRGGGWCKLRPNSTPACDLGRQEGIGTWWMDTKRSIGNLFR
jgi:surface antigen